VQPDVDSNGICTAGPRTQIGFRLFAAPVVTLYNEEMKRKASRALSYSVFYQEAAEGGYVAFVPALPGCHTQGETLEEAKRNVEEAVAL